MKLAKLTEERQRELVLALARFETPKDIIDRFAEEYQVQISPAQVASYDPSKGSFTAGERWRILFNEAREKAKKDFADIPIADQAFRLRKLQQLYDKAEKRGNAVLAANLMEQAAKEVGGVLTNQRRLTHERAASDLSADERREALRNLLAEALKPAQGESVQ